MYSRNGCVVRYAYSKVALEYNRQNSQDSNQILLHERPTTTR